jgi:hypothetical protein
MRYESRDWSLEVPEGWSHEVDDSCATFCHPRGVGAFQVSSFRKDESVTDDALREFAGDTPLAAVSLGRLTGFRTRFSEDDTFWTKGWLRAGRQMIHATYNCPLSEQGHEDAEVSAMLESLIPEYDEQEV